MADKRQGVQLGFTAVGFAVGAYFGAPQLGAAVGSMVGMGVSYAAFGPETPYTEGPRLGDQSIQTSAYGAPIAQVFGTYRVAGNLIWTSGLIEKKTVTGGKGMSQPETGTYSYSAHFALAFCEGEIEEVLRVWADGNLIHDKTGASHQMTHDGIVFRFYKGGEDQLPDPLIESYEGAGSTPAYRGLCYMVFENLQLGRFGNRLPNITAELVNVPNRQRHRDPFNHSAAHYHAELSSYDHQHRRLFFGYSNATDARLHVCNVDTLNETKSRRVADALNPYYDPPRTPIDYFFVSALYASPVTGRAYASVGLGNSRPLLMFDAGLNEVARFGKEGNGFSVIPGLLPEQSILGEGNLPFVTWMAEIETGFADAPSSLGGQAVEFASTLLTSVMMGYLGLLGMFDSGQLVPSGYLLCGTWNHTLALFNYNTLKFVWSLDSNIPQHGNRVTENFSGKIAGMCKGGKGSGWGDAFVATVPGNSPHPSVQFYRLRAVPYMSYIDKGANKGVTPGAEFFEWGGPVAAVDINPLATSIANVHALWFDPADHSVVAFVTLNGSMTLKSTLFKFRGDDGVLWRTHVRGTATYLTGNVNAWQSFYDRNVLAIILDEGAAVGTVNKFNLSTGELIYRDEWPTNQLRLDGAQWYDAVHEAIYYDDADTHWTRVYLDRYTDTGTTLGAIVATLCERCGLAPSEYDVTQLTDSVRGYLIARPSTARSSIEQLAAAYTFDAVESGGVIAFRKRGQSSVLTIDHSDLVSGGEDDDVLVERRTQEVELPERFTVRFTDHERDYAASSQTVRRVAHPVPTTFTRNQAMVDLPIAATPDEAKRWAFTNLHMAYNERFSYEFTLPHKFVRLEPSDVVTVNLRDGSQVTVRVTSVDVGVDFSLRVTGASQEMPRYLSTIEADGGKYGAKTVRSSAPTFLLMPDLPLLRDADSVPPTQHLQYFWATGFSPGWAGAVVHRSVDNVDYEALDTFVATDAMRYGSTVNALAAPSSPWETDSVNHLDVAMVDGEEFLASVSQEAMLNGANAALVYSPDTKVVEVIQFRDVEDLGDGVYRLTNLLRGRRGTDVFCSMHVAGEYFVLLDTDTAHLARVPLSDRGVARYYKAASAGQTLDAVTPVARIHGGFELMPYAPVNGAAELSGADIVLSWTRRTRVGGELQSYVGDVPLNEETESYSIDVLTSSTDVTVKRTLTSTTPSVTYTAAQIAADFGSTPAEVSFVVFQVSAVVGRGFPGVFTSAVA